MRIKTSDLRTYKRKEQTLLKGEVDYNVFLQKSTELMQSDHDIESQQQWALFCKHMSSLKATKQEKLMVAQVALKCFENPLTHSLLAQWMTLSMHLKSYYGIGVFKQLLEAKVPAQQLHLGHYVTVLQLLNDLHDCEGVLAKFRANLPNLLGLTSELQELQNKQLAARYPKRNIDEVLERFAISDSIVKFPISRSRFPELKSDYLAIDACISEVKLHPQSTLKSLFQEHGKIWRDKRDRHSLHILIAVMAELFRRIYKNMPYDTQIIILLEELHCYNANLKGRLGQAKTGEGKSNIFTMLTALLAAQEHFLDFVTANSYLAMREVEKFHPFYEALGLTVGHISHDEQRPEHFLPQILFGTNSDFEFALLRDMTRKVKLRRSYLPSTNQLVNRTFDVVIIDEVDNMLLDNLGAARMAIPGKNDYSWIYPLILDYVKQFSTTADSTIINSIPALRKYLSSKLDADKNEVLDIISYRTLSRWLKSAVIALFQKVEYRDYLVKSDIVIVDYANTGRTNEGSQWQHGLHQFLQAKHQLKITPESITAASISHPTYFGLYKYIYGLTGTMGESVERDEVLEIYQVDSFDAPSHRPSLRQLTHNKMFKDLESKYQFLEDLAREKRKAGSAALIIFESIIETEVFNDRLKKAGIPCQLLNETQRESESYIIMRAGEAGMITLATMVAARGTDPIPSPECLAAGGLHAEGAFFAENTRVEGQLSGRAGRQGQPGTCGFSVYMDEDRVKHLLHSKGDVETTLKFLSGNDETCFEILNRLRTAKIHDESNERRRQAKIEAVFYQHLRTFSDSLQTLLQVFDTTQFKQSLTSICLANSTRAITIPFLQDNAFQTLHHSTRNLLRDKKHGKNIDWDGFISQFNDTYFNYVLTFWAQFYSKMQDDVFGLDPIEAATKISLSYAELQISSLLNEDKVKEIFEGILHHAHQALVNNGYLKNNLFETTLLDCSKVENELCLKENPQLK